MNAPEWRGEVKQRAPALRTSLLLAAGPTQHGNARYCGSRSFWRLSKSAANGNDVFSGSTRVVKLDLLYLFTLQADEVLKYLVEHRERLVSKNDSKHAVWADRMGNL
jgi:hypothetical protein